MAVARAGIRAWNEYALTPDPESMSNWDDYNARMFRYAHMLHYYNNTVYTSIEKYAAQHKKNADLYKHIRGIYNPVNRLVETHVAKVYGGQLDLQTMRGGAIPIQSPDDRLLAPIRQVWKWSNWGTKKSLFVRDGAKLGDLSLWIADFRSHGRLRMEVLDPRKIAEIDRDDVGNVKRLVLEYEIDDPEADDKECTYRMEVDQATFATFRNGEPYGFHEDGAGNLVTEWPNDYGFVPLATGQYVDQGMQWGATPFFAPLGKVDEVNDQASLLNDNIRKVINPLWYYAGVKGPKDLDLSVNERDEIPAVYGPPESQPHPMVADLDIASAGQNIRDLLKELEMDMPELALARIREQGNLTAPGVASGYSDAIDRLTEAQGVCDDVLVRAHKMAITIGAIGGYKGFEGFNINSYDNGDLEHAIAPRPVIADELSKDQRISFLIQAQSPAEAVWQEIGIAQEIQDEWRKQMDEQQAQFNNNLDMDGVGV